MTFTTPSERCSPSGAVHQYTAGSGAPHDFDEGTSTGIVENSDRREATLLREGTHDELGQPPMTPFGLQRIQGWGSRNQRACNPKTRLHISASLHKLMSSATAIAPSVSKRVWYTDRMVPVVREIHQIEPCSGSSADGCESCPSAAHFLTGSTHPSRRETSVD